ncbi:MAG TPA: response regulator [Polyangiaceae bacterium]|jgi:two-component system cell cycle response regulator
MNASVPAAPVAAAAQILIVDDELDNRELLQIVLKWQGFVTRTAANGEEALLSAVRQPPALILVDLMMPGIDGYQLTASLKRDPRTKHIPVIMVSAMNDSATRKRALSAGADAYLTKPIDRSELCEQVRSILGLEARA